MSRFRLVAKLADDTLVTRSFEKVYLPDVVQELQEFLISCGFRFPQGASLGYEYDSEKVSGE